MLFDLSFALMRRFGFVEVACPPLDDYRELVRDAVANLDTGLRSRTEELVGKLLSLTEVRPLGPALFIDAARFVAAYLTDRPGAPSAEVLLSAFFAYLLPQFEGADVAEAEKVRRELVAVTGRAARAEITAMLEQTLGVILAHRADRARDDADDESDAP